MLTNRQMNIINILSDSNNWMTGKEIAKIMNVTDRTIRSDIEAINKYYECQLIESNRRLGYHIDEVLLIKKDIELKEIIPQTSHERCIWIIQELLFRNKEINLIQLQERVFVSGYSIDNDIKKIRKMIEIYPTLKLIRSKNHIRLEGEEIEKRKLYKYLLTEETQGNFMNLNSIADFWSDFDLLEVKDIFENICEKYEYKIRETTFPMIMMHAGVAIERIINHNYLTSDISEKVNESLEYKVSYDFFKSVSKLLNIEIVNDEVKLFALLLLGKSAGDYRKIANEKEEIKELINKLIEKIKDYFGIDFSKDWDLKVGLETHIQSLIERQRNKVGVTNLYLKEIKRKYPLVFEMAIHSAKVIEEFTGYIIDESEIEFLALHLGAAYERTNSVQMYRAVVIIPHNQTLSKPCVDKLNSRFGDRMEVVKMFSFFEESQVIEYEPDLIITTVQVKHNLEIPTIQISLFLNYEDESRVFQLLNNLDKRRSKDDFKALIKKLIRKDLFHIHKTYDTTSKIINKLCDDLVEKNLADSSYKEDVFKRESMSATSFSYGFAVPHSVEVSTNESCISIMILDKPVRWGDFDVRLIILLSIRETDNYLLRTFFDWLSNIVTDSKKLAKLLDVDSYEEFMIQVVE
ncbi:BglG family transcription antiterminator [Peptacetobacter sp.]|uniref:BglG family transcription antiterminator n=1 Tax=Peptacetobacter sp. TaxID=2991975 RepID=UPI00260EE026|nr:BglG family transcription antiterminator [Peptacetobacter sp.]